MKRKPRKFTSSLMSLIVLVTFASIVQLFANPAEAERELYEKDLAALEEQYSDSIEELGDKYLKALAAAAKKLQEAGDLDGLLAINAELANFKKTGVVPIQKDSDSNKAILRFRKIYTVARNNVSDVRQQSISELSEKYLSYLEDLQKKMTQEGEIKQALLVRKEVTRIKNQELGAAPTGNARSKVEETKNSPAPESGEENEAAPQLVVAWNGQRQGTLIGGDGRPASGLKFSHDGENKENDGVLEMTGGRTLIEGLNKPLLDSCKATNELSLVIHFETHNLEQSGPARIISNSLGSVKRNFTLGQDQDKLVLRLRTTDTGENGNNPQVVLCELKQGQLLKVVITYRPGQLNFYIDGQSQPIQQIKGYFSNWEECQFVMGNEWGHDRSWKGRIHQFSIYSSALSPEEALALTK